MGGNWKANGSPAQVASLVAALNSGRTAASTEVVVAPPSVFLGDVSSKLRKDFGVSAQDAFASTGAHTGETPVALLKDLGVKYTIIGHSERRQKWETNDIVAAKAKAAVESGLTVIAALGETLEQRDAGKTFDVVTTQLAVSPGLSPGAAVRMHRLYHCDHGPCAPPPPFRRTPSRSPTGLRW